MAVKEDNVNISNMLDGTRVRMIVNFQGRHSFRSVRGGIEIRLLQLRARQYSSLRELADESLSAKIIILTLSHNSQINI